MAETLGFLRRLLWRDYWWAEFWSAVPSLGWACIGFIALGRPAQPAMLAILSEWMPPWSWLGIMSTVALFQLAALALDSKWCRVAASFVMGWVWCLITVNVLDAAPTTRALALYAGIIGINLVALARQLGQALDGLPLRGPR